MGEARTWAKKRVGRRSLGWLIGLVFLLAFSAYCVKTFAELERGRERAQLVAQMVRHEAETLQLAEADLPLTLGLSGESAGAKAELPTELPDDSLALENWLIVQLAHRIDPADVLVNLRKIASTHRISPTLRTSLSRWQDGLIRWSASRSGDQPTPKDEGVEPLLNEGRLRYFEAKGYSKIGRGYDGAVASLWANSLFLKFLERAPEHLAAPEVLFLVGDLRKTLRHALPAAMRGDRYLTLCSDLYPGSIWATRANAIWHVEIGNGIE